MIKNRTYISIFLLGAIVFISGCAIYNPTADFVKRRYTNTVAYFNTFYNAQRLFNEAEDELLSAQKDFAEKSSMGKPFSVPGSARTKFTSSIEKNSKLLSFYPDSKWVDDALLMIGKAYSYLDDNLKAERKYLELIAKFPESGLINEAKLLLGISYLKQKKVEQGIKQLEEIYNATVENNEEIAGKASYELAQYYFSQNNFEQADKYYRQSLPLLDDGSKQAFVQFQIAQCFENTKQYAQAGDAYSHVRDYSPEYALSFRAELSRLRMLILQAQYDEALGTLERMLDDNKNSDYYGAIYFEIANDLYAKQDYAKAFEKYTYIDTAFSKTDEAARSYFIQAQYFETIVLNYDSARVYYNKAKTEFLASRINPEATLKAEIFNKYFSLQKDYVRFDSLFFNLENNIESDSSFISASDSVRAIDSSLAIKTDIRSKKATRPVKKSEMKEDTVIVIDSSSVKLKPTKEASKKVQLDSIQRSIVRTKFEFGGLFFLELQLPDSALYWFYDIVKHHPQSEFAPRSLYSIAEIYRTLIPRPKTERDSLYSYIISEYPQSPYAQESRKILGLPLLKSEVDSAEYLYGKAEQLTDVNNYSDALSIYNQIAEKFPNSSFAPKSLYALGWHLGNTIQNNDSAYTIYKKLLIQYPSSVFASAVRPIVNEYENEQKRIEQEKKKNLEDQKMKEQLEKELKEPKTEIQQAKPDSLSSRTREK